jgi:hypothetical protein
VEILEDFKLSNWRAFGNLETAIAYAHGHCGGTLNTQTFSGKAH